jgi:hypothetical protein
MDGNTIFLFFLCFNSEVFYPILAIACGMAEVDRMGRAAWKEGEGGENSHHDGPSVRVVSRSVGGRQTKGCGRLKKKKKATYSVRWCSIHGARRKRMMMRRWGMELMMVVTSVTQWSRSVHGRTFSTCAGRNRSGF